MLAWITIWMLVCLFVGVWLESFFLPVICDADEITRVLEQQHEHFDEVDIK